MGFEALLEENPSLQYNTLVISKIDRFYMSEALKEAEKAFDTDEVPVGAIITCNGRVIAKAHNQIKLLKDPTAHAEMIAITQAASYLENERLPDTTLYVTIEPCAMCAGALVLARIKRVCFGCSDPKTGAFGSQFDINKLKLNHKVAVTRGVLGDECASLMKEFFKKKRK
ncbi:MAG: tRNA adenosine(34) deaminase TadA [Candidatus Omnitrophica bacterium]|nr:tRNA adenosine(34) deaminase TadA [Candidatus Omnitrophota bacterium]